MDMLSTGTAQMASATTKNQTAGQKVSGDYQMFLKMLTAQMKNQDPLNPIQSSDYAAQLATFSGVEQQVKTNELLSALTEQLGISGMGQLAAWVGMEARAAVAAPFSGQPVTVYPTPAKDAEKTVLVAYDAQGRETTRQEIPVGPDPVNWTGATPTGGSVLHGTYSFRLESYAGGRIVANDPVEVFSRVTEVRQGEKGPVLILAGGNAVLPSGIKALRPPIGP